MSLLIVLLSLALLIHVAYKGHSVILFAPVAALLAVTGLTHRSRIRTSSSSTSSRPCPFSS